jgi:hypothetical protein
MTELKLNQQEQLLKRQEVMHLEPLVALALELEEEIDSNIFNT